MVIHAAAVEVAVFHVAADEFGGEVRYFAVVDFVEQYAGVQGCGLLRGKFVYHGFQGDAFVEDVVNQQDVFALYGAARAHSPFQSRTFVVAVACGVEIVHAVEKIQAGEELTGRYQATVHHDHDQGVQAGIVQVELGGKMVVGGVDLGAVDQAFAVFQDLFEFLVA